VRIEDLLKVSFTNPKDPFAELMGKAEKGDPVSLLYLSQLLGELTFPFKEMKQEVLLLTTQQDWKPPGRVYEMEVRENALYLEGELLAKANPFPAFGSTYTLWAVEDWALSRFFGEEVAFLNLSPSQLVEVRVSGESLFWGIEERSLPTHFLFALSSFSSGGLWKGSPIFHPSQLANLPFISSWNLPETSLIVSLLDEAGRWGKHLLLNNGRGEDFLLIDGFEEVEGRPLVEWALEGELYLAPSSEGWEIAEDYAVGRVIVSAEEGEVLTLREAFALREDPFTVREQYFVERRAGDKRVLARVER